MALFTLENFITGRKAEKKKNKQPIDLDDKKHKNPKAFAFNSAIRAERKFRRKQDIDTKKQHIPLVDRTPLEPPPILVAVVGPPKVGKSTLISNLIKLFTKSPLVEIKGPVTIVTGKKRRITFMECNNDINSMIDLAKVADLVLLLCDASFGFEMEVFEFLNICQVHGMPKIMGVLTHLDMIKNAKTLKTTKKVLKHRFWTEVYPGAKLFYLSGIIHEEYLRNEIKNLGRFISVMKFRPLTWRTTHGYLLADRYEDLTNQELIRNNPKCDRNISLYGYVRGIPIKTQTYLHVAGLGDLKINDMSFLPDPCPLPEQLKKRALIEKEKLIYAPFSGVGGIVYDKDAVYVDLKGSHSHTERQDIESENMVSNLIDTIPKVVQSEIKFFSNETNKAENADDGDKLEENVKKMRKFEEVKVEDSGRTRRKVAFDLGDHEFAGTIDSDNEENESNNDESNSDNDESDDECDENESNTETKSRIEDEKHSDSESEDSVEKEENEKIDKNISKGGDLRSKILEVVKNLESRKNATKIEENTLNSELDDEEESMQESSSDESTHDDYNAKIEEGEPIDDYDDNVSDKDMGEEENNIASDESSDEEDTLKWKDNLLEKAENAFYQRKKLQNLMKQVYGVFEARSIHPKEQEEIDNNSEEDTIGGLFKKTSQRQRLLKNEKDSMNLMETSLRESWNTTNYRDWLAPENSIFIKNCFVTGKWKDDEDAEELLQLDDLDDNDEMFGDFEDLETGEKHGVKRNLENSETSKEDLAEKKRKLKEKFNQEYDNTEKNSYYDDLKQSAEKQAMLNKTVFEKMDDDVRVQVEGFRPGMYVRIEILNVPSEFVTNFDPTYPLVVGALNMGEENIGYVNVRIKKHRWHSKILKTCDPLIISLGWRRFQTIPIYSKLEDDLKHRYLKYTPEHLGCNAFFWGPITPQGSGFLALQSVDSNPELLKKQGFRVAATGVVQELDKSTQVMKKLKLVGYPLKIYKKTAFIKGMFNSSLEVARFEGARLKTVSGIRGQIKKAVSKPEGCFRATFEDKIQLSDIVFCRTWFKVDVPEFYTPVTSLLLPPEEKNSWKGVRTTGQIKREKGLRNAANPDSSYTVSSSTCKSKKTYFSQIYTMS